MIDRVIKFVTRNDFFTFTTYREIPGNAGAAEVTRTPDSRITNSLLKYLSFTCLIKNTGILYLLIASHNYLGP